MPLNHTTLAFGDTNYAAKELGVLKVVEITCSTGGLGTGAHGLGRVPLIAIPTIVSSSDGSLPASTVCINCDTVTAGMDATNVYVISAASAALIVCYVG